MYILHKTSGARNGKFLAPPSNMCYDKQNEVRELKDIPLFTTEAGIASLLLGEVSYRKEAYVRVQSVQPGKLEELLNECVSFCRMVGAERVLAGDHEELERYPLQFSIIKMQGTVDSEEREIAHLFPVTDATMAEWRQLCNRRLANVDGAATMTAADEKTILSSGGAYFVHRNEELLGAGWVEGNQLRLICTAEPGMGEIVMRTLLSLTEEEQCVLEVASTNSRAIRLYERLGFIAVAELQRWYKIF